MMRNLFILLPILTYTMEKAYALINTVHGKMRLASAKLSGFKEIVEVHEVYGRFDIIAEVETRTRADLKSFIQNKLQITEGIRSTEILLVSDLEDSEEEESGESDDEDEDLEEE